MGTQQASLVRIAKPTQCFVRPFSISKVLSVCNIWKSGRAWNPGGGDKTSGIKRAKAGEIILILVLCPGSETFLTKAVCCNNLAETQFLHA